MYGRQQKRRQQYTGMISAALRGMPSYKYTVKPKPASKVSPKTKTKMAGSKTTTITKKMNQNASNVGGESISTTRVKTDRLNPTLRKLQRTLQPNFYYVNSSGRITATVGKQTAQYITQTFNSVDINAQVIQIPNYNSTSKILLDSCGYEMYITNANQGVCKLYIYDFISRKDTNQVPSTLWSTGQNDQGQGTNSIYNVGMTPFSSPLFCQAFKVIKITKVILVGGYSHLHKISHSCNRQISYEYTNGNLSNATQFRGITVGSMIVAHGMPANDATTKTQVSTGEVALDYVWKKTYTYKYLEDAKSSVNVATNNIPAVFAVSESIISPASGTILSAEGNA